LKEIDKKTADYIQELEDKIVDLSLQLKGKNNAFISLQSENYERIQKLIHNLKNPIGVVYSFSEMMVEKKENFASEKSKKYIDVIKNSASFSIDTLNSLAIINRLNSPKFKLKIEPTNYTELVEIIIDKFTTEAAKKQISIKKKFPENHIFATIDKLEIEQVISVLIQNALRFSSKNTTITIAIQEKEKNIETIITDEGMGIAEKYLQTIFDEFSVVNTYSDNNEKCIGFGLAIAKKIIEYHKGFIAVQSTINKGSRFSFSIPK
jgi:K+-sensing histidine kinase KdpD